MAQVRKFQDGGKTFTLGGYTFNTDNAEDMKMLEDMASDSTYGGIAQSVLDNVRNGSYANTLKMYRTADGRVVMEGGLQNVTDQHLSSGTQKALQRKDTYINNLFKRQSAKDWANNTDAFLNEISRRKTDTSNKKPGGAKITGVYGINEGRFTYTPEGTIDRYKQENVDLLKQYELLHSYYNLYKMDPDAANKAYDVSALDQEALARYIAWRDAMGDDYDINFDRFKVGQTRLNEDEAHKFYTAYEWFGAQRDTAKTQAKLAAEAAKKSLNNKGFRWEGVENDIVINDDGSMYLSPEFMQARGLQSGKGHYFNDKWDKYVRNTIGSNPYSSLQNYVVWGDGRLYNSQDNNFIQNVLNPTNYREYLEQHNAKAADDIMTTFWGDNFETTGPFYTIDQTKEYSPFLHDLGYPSFREIALNNNSTGEHLIELHNFRDGDNPYGIYDNKYIVLSHNGQNYRDATEDDLKNAKTDIITGYEYKSKPSFTIPLNSYGIADVYPNLDSNSKYGISFQPETDNYWFWDGERGMYFIIPKNAIDKQLFNAITNPASGINKDTLLKGMSDMLNASASNFNSAEINNLLSEFNKVALTNREPNDLHNLLQNFKTTLDNFITTRKANRTNPMYSGDRLRIIPPALQKNGGILKFQKGGIKYAPAQYVAPSKPEKPVEIKKPEILQENDSWTNADSWELAALAADTVAAITTILDPTNVVGAVAGIGGSVTNLISDIKRDGFDRNDLWGFLGNLGMDVVSVLPVAGDAVAISRLTKTVKKFAPLFTRAVRLGAITGIGEGAILLFDKIKNGEKLSMSDYRAALNIVTGLTTLKRVGGKNTPTKKKTEGFSDIKSVDGKNTVKLNSKAIDNIKNASPDTKLLKAQEEIVSAHRKKHPADTRSDEQIIDLYDIPTTSKAKHWYNPFSRHKLPDLDVSSTKKVPLTPEEIASVNKDRNAFQRWWYGTGDKQQIYQRQFYGELPNSSVKTTYEPMFPKGMEEQHPFGHPLHVPRGRGVLVPMQEVQTPITGKPHYLPGITFQGDDVLNMVMKHMTEAQYEQAVKDAEKQAEIDELNRLMALPPEYYMQYSYKKGGVLKGQDGLSTLFARPDGKDNKYLKQSERLGNAHFRNTLGRIYQQERLGTQFGDQYADALGKRTVHTPNIKINNRFNDFRSDEADRIGAQYLTQVNQFKTADSGLNAATRMAGEDQWKQLMSNKIDQQSTNRIQQLDRIAQINAQQELYNSQGMNQKIESAVNAEIARLSAKSNAGQQALLTISNAIDNRVAEERAKLNRLGQTKANLEMQATKYDEMAATATDEKARNYYREMATKLRHKSTLDMYLNVGGYSVPSAKKGAKLRSTTEQMLIDKQKLVARAVEKINDNTMKILLKAMS